jgi:hypothetical protein
MVDLQAILNSTDVTQDLIFGFYGGSDVLGTGGVDVGAVVLTIKENGQQAWTKSFSSGSAAKTFFANNSTVDLGLLGPGAGGSGFSAGSMLDVAVSMSVTTTAVGSSFDGKIVIST